MSLALVLMLGEYLSSISYSTDNLFCSVDLFDHTNGDVCRLGKIISSTDSSQGMKMDCCQSAKMYMILDLG